MFNNFTVKTNAFEDVIVRALPEGTVMHRRTSAHLVFTHQALSQIYDWLGRQLVMMEEQMKAANKTNADQSFAEGPKAAN